MKDFDAQIAINEPTCRGFSYKQFIDRYGILCSIQKSSLATEDAIWFGVENPNPQILDANKGWIEFPIPKEVLLSTRMHLTKEMVKSLLPILQKFAETGEI